MARQHVVREKFSEFCCKVIENVSEGVIAVDLHHQIHFFNQAAEKITGFSRDVALESFCFDILRSNICQRECILDETLQINRGIVNRSAIVINKDGEEVPVSVNTSLLYSDSGKIIGVIATFRDLSVEEALRKEIDKTYSFEKMISKNAAMQRIFTILPDIAESGVPVLIQGESGTGKELAARAIHNLGPVREGPFVEINCAAIPETLLESELFGYAKGAFTDAKNDKQGRIGMANGGTLFLDEVGELSPTLQAKLLRVIEDRELTPLGAVKPVRVNVRFVAATNRDLLQMMEEGKFRKDLYFRLDVVKIILPPLRERREDLPLLIDHMIEKMDVLHRKRIVAVSPDVLSVLMRYTFPGNVRELENILEYAFILCKGKIIEVEHLPQELLDRVSFDGGKPLSSLSPLEEAEVQTLQALLKKHQNRDKVAKLLGISRTTLWRKMKRYGLLERPAP